MNIESSKSYEMNIESSKQQALSNIAVWELKTYTTAH